MFEGLDHSDIAARLGITPVTARQRYCRALKRLRELYRELLGSDSVLLDRPDPDEYDGEAEPPTEPGATRLAAAVPAASEPEPALAEGERLGEYRVVRLIGRGAMGEVYLAQDDQDGYWAVKVLSAEAVQRTEVARRFEKEAQLLMKLGAHPNIAAIRDAAQQNGRFYIVMEYVEGTDLEQGVCENGPLPPTVAVRYLRQAASGLRHAHDQNIVHRDIKPSNLQLTRGDHIKVLDFGLAMLRRLPGTEQQSALTELGQLLGTPQYMAPEQMDDARAADGRSDLYSLGCTFYYLITGRQPFEDCQGLEALMSAKFQGEPKPVEEWRPDIDPGIAAIVRRLLAKAPEDRFQSAGELIEALDAVARGSALPPRSRELPCELPFSAAGTWSIRRTSFMDCVPR